MPAVVGGMYTDPVLPRDFFISYSQADRAWAEWMAWVLKEAGHSVVLQAWDFRPGENFVLAMQQAAAQAERTIAVLSPDYLQSRFTQPEWAAAFAKDPIGRHRALLPVRVRHCKLEGLLPQIIYIDLVGLDELAARSALLTGVSSERVMLAQKPAFPGGAPATQNPYSPSDKAPFPGGSADSGP